MSTWWGKRLEVRVNRIPTQPNRNNNSTITRQKAGQWETNGKWGRRGASAFKGRQVTGNNQPPVTTASGARGRPLTKSPRSTVTGQREQGVHAQVCSKGQFTARRQVARGRRWQWAR